MSQVDLTLDLGQGTQLLNRLTLGIQVPTRTKCFRPRLFWHSRNFQHTRNRLSGLSVVESSVLVAPSATTTRKMEEGRRKKTKETEGKKERRKLVLAASASCGSQGRNAVSLKSIHYPTVPTTLPKPDQRLAMPLNVHEIKMPNSSSGSRKRVTGCACRGFRLPSG